MSGLKTEKRYAVISHPDVALFLGKEPDAQELIRQFAVGESISDSFDIAGPPTMAELMRLRAEPDAPFRLPMITIRMSMEKHNLTGEPMVRLTVSDADLVELLSWTRIFRAGQLAARKLEFGSLNVN